ncbi:MAG TPA: ribonuclease T2 [Steroidobacteraceae bacterium]|jgi:ribonuclease T2|nr:ribonuclease T2 [Steroidobacteraceae bacterium]
MRRPGTIGALVLLTLLAPLAVARHTPRGAAPGGVPGEFDYYLLSLSWSPSYCLVHPGDREQCQGRGYGFVLHGLWPQFDAGGYPQQCATHPDLDRAARAVGRTLYPSPTLMQHEWARHGTCSGLEPLEYFRTADRALAVVHTPALFEAPRADQQLAAAQVLAAFRAANPAFPPRAMTVACSRGELSEVRVCLTRTLQPRSCGPGVRDSCPSAPITVPAAR